MQNSKTISINGFTLVYIPDKQILHATFNGRPLYELLNFPEIRINKYNPLSSTVKHHGNVIELAKNIFETINMLNLRGEQCLAAMFASHFYEYFGRLDENFKETGRHSLSIALWLSVLDMVKSWEENHPRTFTHIGTPLYFLAEAYLLVQNNDPAFIYLIKSILDDIELSEHCPNLQYPEKEPAYLTACLVNDPNNHMFEFIVKPLRDSLDRAIGEYNNLFGNESYLKSGIADFESKFLQKRNTKILKIEPIKFLFVLELLQLQRLRTIIYQSRIETSFSQSLRLNRLFSLTLVIDKLLHSRYSPKKRKRGYDANMGDCVTRYANSHGIPQKKIEMLNMNSRDPDNVLKELLQKKNQKQLRALKREIYPILISLKIRNTGAHKIHAVKVLSSSFEEIYQSLLEAVFILAGQMPRSKS